MEFLALTKDREELGWLSAENLDEALAKARSKFGEAMARLEVQTYQKPEDDLEPETRAQMKSAGNAVAAFALWLAHRRSHSHFGSGDIRGVATAFQLASDFCRVMGCIMPSKTAAEISFEEVGRKHLSMD